MQTSITADPTLLPSTSTNYPSCDVFINHRGLDIKDTFAAHLYYRLLSHNLRPFLDREVLQKGDHLHPQIESAIRTASAHITIFSPTYADSKWCLDELVLIVKSGATIIPVFYKVEPSEVRWSTGQYGQALSNHETKGGYYQQRVAHWRKALNDVAYIVGFELKTYNGDEGKLLDNVVQCVLKKREQAASNVAKPGLHVARYPTGLQEKIEDLENTTQKKNNGEVQVLGIVGLGGAGKTTLALELFNRKSCHFNKSCFLYDCRETARQRSLHYLQRKLLKGLGFTQSGDQIDSIEEGIQTLRRYLSFCHALIVLDDLDHLCQLEAFLPIKDVLHSDSLILVTSRYKDVLISSGIEKSSIYNLTGLNRQHSQQLLCSYAFLKSHPLPGFEYLVDEFCDACHGLPLSLKVFGGLLCQKDKSYWIGQLDKLRQIKLPKEIQDSLKISYDALEAEEKQIFLDIACYFIGEDRDMAIRVWDGSDWNGVVGFFNLQGKCLVEVDEENKIKMHDHLRDLGRNIAGEENSLVRLWQTTDNIHDLWQQSYNEQVIIEVRAIRTVPRFIGYDEGFSLEEEDSSESEEEEFSDPESEEEMSSKSRKKMKLIDPIQYRPESEEEEFSEPESEEEMSSKSHKKRKLINPTHYPFRKLQLLATEGGHLTSILRRVESPNLIWLRWNYCPYSCLYRWIPMKNIRVLEVTGTRLKTLWVEESQVPLELRELIIYAPLSRFPKSIGQLKHLEKIVVSSEWALECSRSLPDSFGYLTNLQHLDLSLCRSLQELPNSFGKLIRLKYLNLQGCESLTMSEQTFGNISTLEYLDLSGCNEVEVLPAQVAHQPSLKVLLLADTGLKELPEYIGGLSCLEKLSIGGQYLDNLKSLSHWLPRLTQLSVLKLKDCRIESLALTGCLHSLKYLTLLHVDISEISFGEGVCPNVYRLELTWCCQLRKIEGLCNLTELRELVISQSPELELPSLEGLVSLEELRVHLCKVKRVQGLGQLVQLRVLTLESCFALEEVAGVEHLRLLELLAISSCPRLQLGEGVVEQLKQRVKLCYTDNSFYKML